MKHCYRAGIDIGSTTAKLVILDERGVLCYGDYRRHCAHTQETLAELLEDACAKLGPCDLRLKITGSGAINLGKALNIGFVQEGVFRDMELLDGQYRDVVFMARLAEK